MSDRAALVLGAGGFLRLRRAVHVRRRLLSAAAQRVVQVRRGKTHLKIDVAYDIPIPRIYFIQSGLEL